METKIESNNKSQSKEKQRVTPSKRWCLTKNNYSETDRETMETMFLKNKILYILGYEIGEEGTPHIQGYIEAKAKIRPIEKLKLPFSCHWSAARSDRKVNLKYCSKDNDYVTNFDMPEILEYEEPYGWQLQVTDILANKPDKRTIHWFWEPDGGIGKSELCRYLCIKHEALICSGKATDCKHLIVSQKKPPKIIIFDVPRSCIQYVSYQALEEVKNACFSSPKYESAMHLQNRPHVIVFANEEPNTTLLSLDRWNIVEINKDEKDKKFQDEVAACYLDGYPY